MNITYPPSSLAPIPKISWEFGWLLIDCFRQLSPPQTPYPVSPTSCSLKTAANSDGEDEQHLDLHWDFVEEDTFQNITITYSFFCINNTMLFVIIIKS